MTVIPSGWRFGPWEPDLDAVEHVARCRALRAIARLVAGPRADTLVETLPWLVADAVPVLEAMASLEPRGILSTYGALDK